MDIRSGFCALTALASSAVLSADAKAAEIRLSKTDNTTFVILRGEIRDGDEARFDALVKDIKDYVVMLTSPGGDVATALSIGATIHDDGSSTYVVEDAECSSACALIWLAGRRRVMAADSRIGFHASYRMTGSSKTEDGMSNAVVGSYMTNLGLPIQAVAFATAATPDGLNMIDSSKPGQHGISFEVLRPKTQARASSQQSAEPKPDTAVFGKWTAFGYPDGTSGMITATDDKSGALFLSCKKGPCRIGVSFEASKCEAGESYTLAYKMPDASPVTFDATCSASGDMLYADSSVGLLAAFSEQTFTEIGMMMESGSLKKHRFGLVGFDQALASLKSAGYVE